jgi:hypothetical protein
MLVESPLRMPEVFGLLFFLSGFEDFSGFSGLFFEFTKP